MSLWLISNPCRVLMDSFCVIVRRSCTVFRPFNYVYLIWEPEETRSRRLLNLSSGGARAFKQRYSCSVILLFFSDANLDFMPLISWTSISYIWGPFFKILFFGTSLLLNWWLCDLVLMVQNFICHKDLCFTWRWLCLFLSSYNITGLASKVSPFTN
jgi:hypothetical protein